MKRVAVLRGGPSEEYEVSLQSGGAVLSALDQLQYPHRDIVISKKGEWVENGVVRQPETLLEGIDVVFIALHGTYGEDGQVQRILQRLNIPFTGSDALTSAIAFNKDLTKITLRSHGITMPRHRCMGREELDRIDEEAPNIMREIGPELFVKPLASGSSMGAKYVPHLAALKDALQDLLARYEQVMVEEFIRGREATVGVLSNFRNEELYTLPVVEIVPPNGEPLFSYENKYNGQSDEIVPGRFSYGEKDRLASIAAAVHKSLNLQGYSRSDFIVRDGEIYFLEVNTLPGLTEESLFPKTSAAVGLEFPHLIAHLVANVS